jgi:hypothetical protein
MNLGGGIGVVYLIEVIFTAVMERFEPNWGIYHVFRSRLTP